MADENDKTAPLSKVQGETPSEIFQLNEELLRAHPKYEELFVQNRSSSVPAAVFNLTSTIIGGGSLSIPYAINRAGLVLGLGMLVLSALACDWSVYLLTSCSRRTGGNTYREVAEKAFGKVAGVVVLLSMFALIFLCCVAFAILIRDIMPSLLELAHIISRDPSNQTRQIVMVATSCAVMPFSFAPSLHSLRFISVGSVLGIFILAVCLTYHAIASALGDHSGIIPSSAFPHRVKLWPESPFDVLYAFPVLAITFLCHFNVLAVHGELKVPSKKRVKRVIHTTVFICVLFYSWIGLAGYLTTYGETRGNIFTNFSSSDPAIAVARACFSFNFLSFPIIILPCRDALAEVLTLVLPNRGADFMKRYSIFFGVILSMAVVAASLLVAVQVKSIVTIWNYMGSTVGVFVSFILPPAMYLKARRPHLRSAMTIPAWALLIFGVVANALCFWEATRE